MATYTDAQLLEKVRECIAALTTITTGADGTIRPPAKSYTIYGRTYTAVDLSALVDWEKKLQAKINAVDNSRAAAGVEFRGANGG